MPNLDGFGLTAGHPEPAPAGEHPGSAGDLAERWGGSIYGSKWNHGYIVKSEFDEGRLLSAVSGLLGKRE